MSQPVAFKPVFPYTLLFNGQDVTDLQLKRFFQKQRLAILKKYDFTYDNFSLTLPFDYKKSFTSGLDNNIVQINEGVTPVFVGYVADKVVNVGAHIYEIDARSFLNLLSKSETTHAETAGKNAIREIVSIFNAMLAKIDNYYYLSSQANSLSGLFKISMYVSSTAKVNDINMILALCELLDVGIYFKGTAIHLYAVPETFPVAGAAIENYVINPVSIQQATELYYDSVSVTYKTSSTATEATVTAGSGNIVKSLSYSDFYLDAASAQAVADRKLAIYSKDYYYIENIQINNQFSVKLGETFTYAGFVFVCTAVEETQSVLKISGIGVEL